MSSYHRISQGPECRAWSEDIRSSRRQDTNPRSNDQISFVIIFVIICIFSHTFDDNCIN